MSVSEIETQQRVLEAAGEVFAERGFYDTTVREICTRAKANVAAVNYHFGDKASLYRAVLSHARKGAIQEWGKEVPATETAEERLHGYVQSLLLRMFDKGQPAWLAKLLTREMVEPTGALDEIVEHQVRPNHLRLKNICAEILGTTPESELARQAAFSVVAQCAFYQNCRTIVNRLYPATVYTPELARQLADYIVRFSIGGMKALVP